MNNQTLLFYKIVFVFFILFGLGVFFNNDRDTKNISISLEKKKANNDIAFNAYIKFCKAYVKGYKNIFTARDNNVPIEKLLKKIDTIMPQFIGNPNAISAVVKSIDTQVKPSTEVLNKSSSANSVNSQILKMKLLVRYVYATDISYKKASYQLMKECVFRKGLFLSN